jgi:hypothetical protein
MRLPYAGPDAERVPRIGAPIGEGWAATAEELRRAQAAARARLGAAGGLENLPGFPRRSPGSAGSRPKTAASIDAGRHVGPGP